MSGLPVRPRRSRFRCETRPLTRPAQTRGYCRGAGPPWGVCFRQGVVRAWASVDLNAQLRHEPLRGRLLVVVVLGCRSFRLPLCRGAFRLWLLRLALLCAYEIR